MRSTARPFRHQYLGNHPSCHGSPIRGSGVTHELSDVTYAVTTLRHQFSNDAFCVVADADLLLRARCCVGSPESWFD